MKRFYQAAGIESVGAHATVLLDGRPLRTPARAALHVPEPIALRIAEEWNAQGEFIAPATMPLTRLANSAIDGVSTALLNVRADIIEFASNDLVFYRADEPDGLVANQRMHWDPLVRFAEALTGVRLVLGSGVMPVRQDPRFTDALGPHLPSTPLELAALHQFTTITGSALAALAVSQRHIAFDDAWAAAHVDEDWNMLEWGEDEQAIARRAARRRDAEAAHFVFISGAGS